MFTVLFLSVYLVVGNEVQPFLRYLFVGGVGSLCICAQYPAPDLLHDVGLFLSVRNSQSSKSTTHLKEYKLVQKDLYIVTEVLHRELGLLKKLNF